MNKPCQFIMLLFLPVQFAMFSCNGQVNKQDKTKLAATGKSADNYQEGNDYILFNRVRILDKTGFENGAEAYSLLLPKGWQQQSDVVWNMPQTPCAGTFKWLSAKSPDGKYQLEMYPDILFTWTNNPDMAQSQSQSTGSYCSVGEPLNAEQYLRNVFAPKDLSNPKIIKVEANPYVVKEMQQANEKARTELMQYGATNIQFFQTAINATVQWPDKSEGLIVLGVTVMENDVPNIYTGTSSKSYTTSVMKRTVYRYPAGVSDQAINQFSVIMGSFRTNTAWTNAVNKYWLDVRQRKHVAHIGTIKMLDDQTRAMGNAAIAKGNARLNTMDMDLRNWEQRQASQDRMHTNFIKTIREVENYQDPTGKIELSSGYNHAWSRGDGTSFIMSNDPNFNPASVLLDQNWKEMRKVD